MWRMRLSLRLLVLSCCFRVMEERVTQRAAPAAACHRETTDNTPTSAVTPALHLCHLYVEIWVLMHSVCLAHFKRAGLWPRRSAAVLRACIAATTAVLKFKAPFSFHWTTCRSCGSSTSSWFSARIWQPWMWKGIDLTRKTTAWVSPTPFSGNRIFLNRQLMLPFLGMSRATSYPTLPIWEREKRL